MNFEFSDELNEVRAQARAVLKQHATGSARRAMESNAGFDAALWAEIGKLGWIGAAIPEEYGGSAVGEEGLCVIAEEIGHSLAATPFASSAYLASQALLKFGSEAQKQKYLPRLADGSMIGCFALAEGTGAPRAESIGMALRDNALHGSKHPVVDGGIAHVAIVAAMNGRDITLAICELGQGNVARERLQTIDPSRDAAENRFPWRAGRNFTRRHRILQR